MQKSANPISSMKTHPTSNHLSPVPRQPSLSKIPPSSSWIVALATYLPASTLTPHNLPSTSQLLKPQVKSHHSLAQNLPTSLPISVTVKAEELEIKEAKEVPCYHMLRSLMGPGTVLGASQRSYHLMPPAALCASMTSPLYRQGN